MKDYDINIKGSCEVKVFGTNDNTMVVPASVKFDSDRNKADIDIKDERDVKIGIPGQAEKIELNITDSRISVTDIKFEQLEIDGKGDITIEVSGVEGKIDINMIGGTAKLMVPSGFAFSTECKGKNNRIECDLAEDQTSPVRIELNGKDTRLTIVNG